MEFTLRDWTIKDAPDLAKAMNNRNVQDNLRDGIPFPYTEQDAAEYIAGALEAPPDSQYIWAVVVDGRPVGCIGIYRKDSVPRLTAELGYYLAEEYWGRGIGSAAVEEACRVAFQQTDLVRIFAEPFARNAASCRLLEKAGFRLEGTLRKNVVKNGEIIDMRLYAMVRE